MSERRANKWMQLTSGAAPEWTPLAADPCVVRAPRERAGTALRPRDEGFGCLTMTDAVPDPLPPGYQLGTYLIQSELAPARMGRVYRAIQTTWNEVVAINVLSPAMRDRESRARFFDCIRRAYDKGRDQERNPVLDICDLEGVTCVVVRYAEGSGAPLDVAEE